MQIWVSVEKIEVSLRTTKYFFFESNGKLRENELFRWKLANASNE